MVKNKEEKKESKKSFWKAKVINKPILKKQPRPTYVVEPNQDYRSSSFRKEWNKQNLLGWQ